MTPQTHPDAPRLAHAHLPKPERGMLTVAQLRARCRVDPQPNGCWHWLGAMSGGYPRMWTFDHAIGDKRVMSGPQAVWNIAHGESPGEGVLVYRRCVVRDCCNPVHLARARSRAEIHTHAARSGKRKGTALESRRANARLAMAAAGNVPTPADIVLAIRAADAGETNRALAKRYGVSETVTSSIRLGKSHRGVVGVAA